MDNKRAISVVVTIPAFNEEATVGEVIGAVLQEIKWVSRVDIVVINDGSTDNTADVAAKKRHDY